MVPTGLLKGIDPLLTADLLYVLRLAGHGDVISVVDVNFPAAEVASKTIYGKPIVLAGVEVDQATAAICSVCPLDRFIDCPAQYMYPSPGSEVPPLGVVRAPTTDRFHTRTPPAPGSGRPILTRDGTATTGGARRDQGRHCHARRQRRQRRAAGAFRVLRCLAGGVRGGAMRRGAPPIRQRAADEGGRRTRRQGSSPVKNQGNRVVHGTPSPGCTREFSHL